MATEEEKIKAVKAACSQAIIDKQNGTSIWYMYPVYLCKKP